MSSRMSYRTQLKQQLGELIDGLALSDLQKRCLHARWLDQVLWMEAQASRNLFWYSVLRLTTIVGGVIVPALVSVSAREGTHWWVQWAVIVLSLVVAISAAVEQFFHFGERWRHYRRTVESLKSEGWQFFELSGPYRGHDSHVEAYRDFAARVEDLSQQDVEGYFTRVMREKEPDRDKDKPAAS